jgi:hypothetical protein
MKNQAKKIVTQLVDDVLPTGVLTDEFVLSKIDALLNLLRDANATCKWLMLHRLSYREDVREIVREYAKPDTILSLLLYES